MSSLLIAIKIISQMDPVIGTQKTQGFIIGSTSGIILKVAPQVGEPSDIYAAKG